MPKKSSTKAAALKVQKKRPEGVRGIQELVWVHKEDLTTRKNPSNWRKHPRRQVEALENTLQQNGWAGACLFNKTTGKLIDGHAREEIDLAKVDLPPWVPVLVGEWTIEQERHILLTLDPIAAMAEENAEMMRTLVDSVQESNSEVLESLEENHGANQLLDTLHNEAVILDPKGDQDYELMSGYEEDDSTLIDDTEVERQEERRRVKCPTCGQLAPANVVSQTTNSASPESSPQESGDAQTEQ